MIYAVKVGGIGGKTFYLDDGDTWDHVCNYCENQYGFHGEEWAAVKSEFDYESLNDFLESKDIEYEDFDDE